MQIREPKKTTGCRSEGFSEDFECPSQNGTAQDLNEILFTQSLKQGVNEMLHKSLDSFSRFAVTLETVSSRPQTR